MAANDPRLDPVSVASLLFTAWVGNELSGPAGAYAVIVACGLVGGGFGLSRWRSCTRFEAAAYLVGMTTLSVLTSVSIADMVVWFVPTLQRLWLIAPVAVLVAGIGHDWPALIARGAAIVPFLRTKKPTDPAPDQEH